MKKNRLIFEFFLLLLLSFILMALTGFHPQKIIFMLTAFLLSAPSLLLPRYGRLITTLSAFGLSLFWSEYCFFFPAILRANTQKNDKQTFWFSGLLLLRLAIDQQIPLQYRLLLLLISGGSFYLFHEDRRFQTLQQQYLQIKDDSWEKQAQLQKQNQLLQASQETRLSLQIAQERNRIARDIHDNVGHLLSSAIIQLGAIEALNQAQNLKEPLGRLSETIHSGMDRIRESVHDLHQTSLPFDETITQMVAAFDFCPITVTGTPSNQLSAEQKRVLILTLKEALNNVMRHSNASHVMFHFSELPAFYRCQITDNGTLPKAKKPTNDGIGLQAMRQRIEQLAGQMHIVHTKVGFKITVILPKEEQT